MNALAQGVVAKKVFRLGIERQPRFRGEHLLIEEAPEAEGISGPAIFVQPAVQVTSIVFEKKNV